MTTEVKQPEKPKNFTSFKTLAMSAEEHKQAAEKSGWKDNKEAVEAEGKEFIDAPEFNRRGPLLKLISKQSRQIKDLTSRLDAQAEQDAHFRKVHQQEVQRAYDRAVEDLKSQRLEHLEAGEHKQAAEIEEKLDELKVAKEKEDAQAPKEVPKLPRELQDWMDEDRNQWYHEDEDLQGEYEGLLAQERRKDTKASVKDLLERADKRFAKKHPDLYEEKEDEEQEEEEEQPKQKVAKVAGASRSVAKKAQSKYTWNDLPDDGMTRQIAQNMVDNGTFKSRQAYVDSYFAKFGKE